MQPLKQREYRWDNIKFFLIFLVILGHAGERFADDFAIERGLFMFIYTFHMPAFIFISGLFSNRTVDSDRYRYDKLLPFLGVGVVLSLFRDLSLWVWNKGHEITLIDQNKISWFMFTLFVCYSVSWLFHKVPKKSFVMAGSIVFALAIGYCGWVGEDYALSRTIVYFPFFYAGYLIDRKKLNEYFEISTVRTNAIISTVAFFIFCLGANDRIYMMRPFVTGQHSYYDFEWGAHAYTFLIRAGYYLVAFLFMLAFMASIPDKEIKGVTSIGGKTLAIYFWHLPFIHSFLKIGPVNDFVGSNLAIMLIVCLALSVGGVYLFSLKPFVAVVNWLMNWENYRKVGSGVVNGAKKLAGGISGRGGKKD